MFKHVQEQGQGRIAGPSQCFSISVWFPGSSYQGCSGDQLDNEWESFYKCLFQRSVDTDSDSSLCLHTPLMFPGTPLWAHVFFVCEVLYFLLSLEDVSRTSSRCSWFRLQESEYLKVCGDFSWWLEMRKYKVQIPCPELGHPLSYNSCSRVSLKAEAEGLPKIPYWRGPFPFPVLPLQSLTGPSFIIYLHTVLVSASVSGKPNLSHKCNMIEWSDSSWQLDDYKNIYLLNIFLDTVQCICLKYTLLHWIPHPTLCK